MENMENIKNEEFQFETIDFYSAEVKCENCGDVRLQEIPKGISVYNQFQDVICDKCSCEIFIKSNKRRKKRT